MTENIAKEWRYKGYDPIIQTYMKPWEVLLEAWCNYFEAMWEHSQVTDVALSQYRLVEPVLVGSLACAAAQKEWVVIMERQVCRDDNPSLYNRADLWLKRMEGTSEYVECKYKPVEQSDIKSPNELLKTSFYQISTIECREMDRDDMGAQKVAVAFIGLKLDKIDLKQIENFIQSIRQSLQFDALAWCFPQGMGTVPHKGKHYPGVVLLAIL